MIKHKFFIICTILMFFTTLYWVCYSPWSSRALAKYNDGYGTFDMKSYDAPTVYQVLDHMNPEGFTIYQKYFIGDYLFIIAFGILQIMLSLYAYSWIKSKSILGLVISVPIIRGICDLVENSLLLYILQSYPQKHINIISLSDKFTYIKLKLIPIWLLIFLTGIIIKYIKRNRRKI